MALTDTQANWKAVARIDGTRQDTGVEVLRSAQDDDVRFVESSIEVGSKPAR